MKMTLEDWQSRGHQDIFRVFPPSKGARVVHAESTGTYFLTIDGTTEQWASLQGIALRMGKTRPSLLIGEAGDKEDR